ncbi:hypothetical protein AB0L40_04205 [Patulibacter sp. NPDC049589]|uniref:hypothetical protein n=1 Tax=Patulibacter sp. NPDC049589 TaxID=3154731 RepID=UPI0034413C49
MLVRHLRAWLHPVHEPVLLAEPLRTEVVELLRGGKAIEAMKITNRRTGIGLAATKRAVDAVAATEGLDATL